MKCFACDNELDTYAKCLACYDKKGAECDQLRARNAELEAEVARLRKALEAPCPEHAKMAADEDARMVAEWYKRS